MFQLSNPNLQCSENIFRQVMKKGSKKTKSPKRPPAGIALDGQNIAPGNSQASPNTEFIQAKPILAFSGHDLSGSWKTCGQTVKLTRDNSSETFEGEWGVHKLRFQLDGSEIIRAKLGSMDLMFGGSLSDINKICWGNGQVWIRL
jgi:hypothetical protein